MSLSPGSLATIWSDRTTHTLVPSWRRVYTSRAIWMAIFGSAACRLPQCLWSRPDLLRTKTSHRGHSAAVEAVGAGLAGLGLLLMIVFLGRCACYAARGSG